MFLFLILYAALPPPPKMELILGGHVKELRGENQGNYSLASELVNGLPYWLQNSSFHGRAIWSAIGSSARRWIVGDKEKDLGTNRGQIAGPLLGIDVWPTQILSGYLYDPGQDLSPLPAHPSDIFFKDCKSVRLFISNEKEFLNVKSNTTCTPSPKLFQIHFWT